MLLYHCNAGFPVLDEGSELLVPSGRTTTDYGVPVEGYERMSPPVPSATEAQREWGREVIARQVQRMALLLDDLLDVSRITRGRLELRKDYVSLQALVAAATESARPLIEAKHHTLDIALPLSGPSGAAWES